MTQEPPELPSPPQTNALLQAPLEVIRQLKNEPVLLGGMGASVLVAILALFVPDSARSYAWIIAGLMLILCLVRAAVGTRGGKAGKTPLDTGDGSNQVTMGGKSEIDAALLEAERKNLWRSGRKTKIKDLTMRAGGSRMTGENKESRQSSGEDQDS
jgi:hypothetical protein